MFGFRRKKNPVTRPEPVETSPSLYINAQFTEQPKNTILKPVKPVTPRDVRELSDRLDRIDRGEL